MANGHPSKCATAKVGSVCHCDCAGVRHGWHGAMSSGVKAPQGGLSGQDGTKTPPATLAGVNGLKVPQSTPALDGLSGDKAPTPAPAPAPVEPAPPAQPAAQEPNPPAAPAEPDTGDSPALTFDERVTAALTGDDARTSAPRSLARDDGDPFTDAQRAALVGYLNAGFTQINTYLRDGSAPTGTDLPGDDTVRASVRAIDESMEASPLPRDVVTWRGMSAGDRLFGDAFSGDLTGAEWREDAYASTSTDRDTARQFAEDPDTWRVTSGSTMMRIVTPAGTGAVEVSDGSYEAELLLERGLRMRVVADRGVDEDGVRQLDVEVLPSDRQGEEADEGAAETGDVGEETPGGDVQSAAPDPAEGRTDPEVPAASGVAAAAAGADDRPYDARVSDALTEVEARTSPPLSRVREGTRALTDDEREIVEEYMGDGFLPINHMLRGGPASELERWDRRDRGFDLTPAVVDGWTGQLDSLMDESRLPQPIVTWRGMRNGDTLFGDAFADDLTGAEWSDAAFSSTSTDEEEALAFSQDTLGNSVPGSTVMHVLVPSGVGALELSDDNYESEVLLSRGLRFRVVNDWGHNEHNGVRVLDVEVVLDAG